MVGEGSVLVPKNVFGEDSVFVLGVGNLLIAKMLFVKMLYFAIRENCYLRDEDSVFVEHLIYLEDRVFDE